MNKLLFFLCCAFFIACNNEGSSPQETENKSNSNTSNTTEIHLSKQAEFEILAGCVDNARESAGADLDSVKVYALCHCILRQTQEKYPDADSTALVNHLSDTAQVAQMVQKCK